MTKQMLTLIALAATALPALAAEEADTNGDGMLSVDEVQAIWPEVSTDGFISMDADGDGLLNEEEVAAARELGSLPEAG
ncbi:hypothetical protein M4578_17860 [Salipiger sp. P9]|uniref:hypothetical protein n=1 Tax=Salipiger pentaromativorans TaxID=2943193 RepID=UPI002156F87F|nr:hypothetical protein [Salipiger pentaromativorans]MCR8549699.1 hypothetical protein [Salipiger pentaromativorans]